MHGSRVTGRFRDELKANGQISKYSDEHTKKSTAIFAISELVVQFNMSPTGLLLNSGSATGKVIHADVSLSFWGGIDTQTGIVVDRHHPLCGTNLHGTILAIPGGRGSSTGSGAILELLLNDCAPAALIFARLEQILTLGVWIAKAMFDRSIPVLVLDEGSFSTLKHQPWAEITPTKFRTQDGSLHIDLPIFPSISSGNFRLSAQDREMLSGTEGEAAKLAIQIIILFAKMQGAELLIDVTQAHIDACIYVGPSSLNFPRRLLQMNAKVAVPSTLNALSVDMRRYKELGTDPDTSKAASDVAETYLKMGASVSFTCAPYLLQTAPKSGENIGWAESNAVVFANSVLGARTQKYPDFLDVFIALTGRAPNAGCHTEKGRLPTVCVNIQETNIWDDLFFPLVGYCVGEMVGSEIPFIVGMENTQPTASDLKAFGAAFATTSAAAMFHIRNVTPEAMRMGKLKESLTKVEISVQDLRNSWRKLNNNVDSSVSLISLGNPHFSLMEMEEFSNLVKGRWKDPSVSVVITTSREVYEGAVRAGHTASAEAFGASFITDTCWCMIGEPITPLQGRNLMTNSAKYAHYAPGLINRGVHFGSLSQCIEAAESGVCRGTMPAWLADQ